MRLKRARAQALLELALCAPIAILLALGTVAAVQIAGARAGLDAATQADSRRRITVVRPVNCRRDGSRTASRQ